MPRAVGVRFGTGSAMIALELLIYSFLCRWQHVLDIVFSITRKSIIIQTWKRAGYVASLTCMVGLNLPAEFEAGIGR